MLDASRTRHQEVRVQEEYTTIDKRVKKKYVQSQSRTNFKVIRFENCKPDSAIKLNGNVTTEGDRQYATIDLVLPVAADEHIGGTCDIHTLLTNTTAISIFTIREKYACKACNKYMGEFWYDLIRAAQLPVGVCPVSAVSHFPTYKENGLSIDNKGCVCYREDIICDMFT
ncbi:hypothetical protein ILUMI_21521 [Ignelater luminosus]|uniref:Uncharacterized protein n=1 Tax=Ignelater luminosus TaxID=2038154 RepID=A0A8K0CFH4_IGNLU|nr:hypothetical protein ILUMI_21521 [Ignelater luminosus]